ncbi:MAG: PIG-L family deacetylase [Armatimonadetes bacterium]|nr:PIG-L family deacetylase [Armatimonadota bacterium]
MTEALGDSLFRGRTLLVVAPHPDDEVLGCGGTIARAVQLGARVCVMIVSVGDLRRVGDGGEVAYASARMKEVEAVAARLGIHEFEFIFTDEQSHLRLDAIPRRDLVAHLERDARLSVTKLRPDFVFLPAPSYNQDHEAVARAGLVACRPHDPNALPMPPGVLLYEYPPNSWCLPQERFLPNLYVDITEQLPEKLAAYGLYESQARNGLHQNHSDNVKHLALLRGREAGVEAAEAFQVQRLRL